MSFESTARTAGQDLRQASHSDVEAAFAEFQRAAPRRRRARSAVAVGSVAAALVICLTAVRWLLPEDARSTQPVQEPDVTPSSSATASPTSCDGGALITCQGGRHYTVALTVPMDWTIPGAFEVPYSGSPPSKSEIETYMDGAGVTVLEDIHAAQTRSRPAVVPEVTSAASFANWIADRPFLSSSKVRRGELSGRRAWIVDAVVKPGQGEGPATCNAGTPCYPILLYGGDNLVGAWEGITGRYTVIDLPGAGVTVVWSWSFDVDIPPATDELISSIRFH